MSDQTYKYGAVSNEIVSDHQITGYTEPEIIIPIQETIDYLEMGEQAGFDARDAAREVGEQVIEHLLRCGFAIYSTSRVRNAKFIRQISNYALRMESKPEQLIDFEFRTASMQLAETDGLLNKEVTPDHKHDCVFVTAHATVIKPKLIKPRGKKP